MTKEDIDKEIILLDAAKTFFYREYPLRRAYGSPSVVNPMLIRLYEQNEKVIGLLKGIKKAVSKNEETVTNN